MATHEAVVEAEVLRGLLRYELLTNGGTDAKP
jgi:hypothetical protein